MTDLGKLKLDVETVVKASPALSSEIVYSDLQRSEAAIRASEQCLRLIVDTIPGFVCTLSPAGEIELLNRQVLEYFGKPAEDLKDWATSDAVHPDDLPRVIDAWRHSVATGQPYENEHRNRRADGVYRWFHSRALPARDTEGRVTGWYMLLTDIDDRKHGRREAATQRSLPDRSAATSAGPAASAGGFPPDEILWSEETFRIFRIQPDRRHLQSKRFSNEFIPNDAALVQQSHQSCVAGWEGF